MKKVYQTPECLAMLLAEDDVLTASFNVANKNDGEGNFESGGAVIEW